MRRGNAVAGAFCPCRTCIGDCYVDQGQAAEAFEKARAIYPRKEWALNVHAIGRCDWQEGFVRCWSEPDDA